MYRQPVVAVPKSGPNQFAATMSNPEIRANTSIIRIVDNLGRDFVYVSRGHQPAPG